MRKEDMKTTLRPLAALALVALICVGCSKAPSDNSAGNTTAANHDQAVKFAECMRNNGVSQFPDPDASGSFTIDGVVNGSSIDTTTAAWKNAVDTCKGLEPAGFMGSTRTAEQQQNALKFAQCIRDNGVKDFPDPVNGEPLVNTYKIPSSNRPGGMAILNAAMRKCGHVLKEAAGGQG